MGVEKIQAHRPGAFKQSNKEHKHGRHRSKGSINTATKGKVSVKPTSKKNKRELSKWVRNQAELNRRKSKIDKMLAKKRSLGGLNNAPFLVCILPLNKQLDPVSALSILTQCSEETVVPKSSGVTHISLPRFKQQFDFVIPQLDNDLSILDCLKVSDTVLFLLSAALGSYENEFDVVDEWGTNILTSAFAQGLPTPVIALTDLESIAPKKRNEFKQKIQKVTSKWLPEEKLMVLDKNVDGINLLRKIGNQKQKSVLYRDRRPHLYGEEVEFCPENEVSGTLKVAGYLRGSPLCVNDLVHIPGLGDFQMSKIEVKENNGCTTVMCDPNKQESLDSENIPDPMDAEQTWPTNEEIETAQKEEKLKKVKKIPKGWSDYQAAWIPDDDAEFQSDASDEEEEDLDNEEFMDAISEESLGASDEEEDRDFDTVTESEVAPNDDKYDQQFNVNEEKEELNKLKAAKTDFLFPDEIDTPLEQPARVRFQKYRGLESFRTSPWDPKENLPSDYARIFQFQNFDRTKKRIVKRDVKEEESALVGKHIIVYINNVSQLSWATFKETKSPVILVGLFAHEHKMSVMNVVLKRTQFYKFPIKSKERLIFQCGYRRFVVNPIFSAHTNGHKHKFERYFQAEATSVATFYAPIQFPPAPVLCYKEVNNQLILVATGSLLSCNPDRLVIKRIVLSGHPLKIHKKSAVIRFMFFNREDIIYFKPCKLNTKMGRSGHIKEPLGTHGHMKCVFDGQLKSQDTILLNLYKRVFPKWTYEELVVSCANNDSMEI